jgi:hypothetical protein
MDKHLKCFKTLEKRKDWQQEATTIEVLDNGLGMRFPKVPGRKLDLSIADGNEGKDFYLKLSVRDRGNSESKPVVLIDLPMAGDNKVDLRVLWVEKGFSITNKQLKILADWLCSPIPNGGVTYSDAIWNWMLWEIDV